MNGAFKMRETAHWSGARFRREISTDGGTEPVWSHNGRELFYRRGRRMMAVALTGQPAFSAAKPATLFEGDYEESAAFPNTGVAYDVAPDGQRFLMVKTAGPQPPGTPPQLRVVVNWDQELKRRVPAN